MLFCLLGCLDKVKRTTVKVLIQTSDDMTDAQTPFFQKVQSLWQWQMTLNEKVYMKLFYFATLLYKAANTKQKLSSVSSSARWCAEKSGNVLHYSAVDSSSPTGGESGTACIINTVWCWGDVWAKPKCYMCMSCFN